MHDFFGYSVAAALSTTNMQLKLIRE